ncbi:calcium-binding protein [Devosia ginsengisoli]|nr:hypothetical protein [Devosia ginsengisoli]
MTATIEQDTGIISVVDDAPGVTFAVDNPVNEFGEFYIDASTGEWTFTLGTGPAVQALSLGDAPTTTFRVIITDAGGLQTTADIVITINGTNEVFDGTPYDDFYIGTPFVDEITGGAGDDTLYGGSDDDFIDGGDGDDTMDGGSGNDTIFGRDGDDTIDGGSGDDFIGAGTGDDLVNGGSGNDTIHGGQGDDTIHGNGGGDMLYGGGGDDTIHGGDGDDLLDGGGGHDNLYGGSGDDILWGGTGRDTLTGGAGADTFKFISVEDSSRVGKRDTITDFEAGDKIDLTQFDANSDLSGHQQFIFRGLGANNRAEEAGYLKYMHDGNQTILVGGVDNDGDGLGDFILAIDGILHLTSDDFVLGSVVDLELDTGTVDDETFYSVNGRDVFTGGGGSDTFVIDNIGQSSFANWDVITDFGSDDYIDLRGMDLNIDSLFHALNGNSTVQHGDIKLYQSGNDTFILGDQNGDRQADFKIQLLDINMHDVTLDNFIL